MIKLADEQLKQAADKWLNTKGLKWSQVARSIDPELLGQNLSRLCVYRGLIKKPARNHTRCQHCKRIRRDSSFCTVSKRKRHCNDCRDYFSKRRGALNRLTDDELSEHMSTWDVVISDQSMRLWSMAWTKR